MKTDYVCLTLTVFSAAYIVLLGMGLLYLPQYTVDNVGADFQPTYLVMMIALIVVGMKQIGVLVLDLAKGIRKPF